MIFTLIFSQSCLTKNEDAHTTSLVEGVKETEDCDGKEDQEKKLLELEEKAARSPASAEENLLDPSSSNEGCTLKGN